MYTEVATNAREHKFEKHFYNIFIVRSEKIVLKLRKFVHIFFFKVVWGQMLSIWRYLITPRKKLVNKLGVGNNESIVHRRAPTNLARREASLPST